MNELERITHGTGTIVLSSYFNTFQPQNTSLMYAQLFVK